MRHKEQVTFVNDDQGMRVVVHYYATWKGEISEEWLEDVLRACGPGWRVERSRWKLSQRAMDRVILCLWFFILALSISVDLYVGDMGGAVVNTGLSLVSLWILLYLWSTRR